MDNDKIILETYAKMEVATALLTKMDKSLDKHIEEDFRQHNAMWKKIDLHSNIIQYFIGALAVVGFSAKCYWFKIKTWFVG